VKRSEKIENCQVTVTVEVVKVGCYGNTILARSERKAAGPFTAAEATSAIKSLCAEAKAQALDVIAEQVEEDADA
jgi:hypothetical protein